MWGLKCLILSIFSTLYWLLQSLFHFALCYWYLLHCNSISDKLMNTYSDSSNKYYWEFHLNQDQKFLLVIQRSESVFSSLVEWGSHRIIQWKRKLVLQGMRPLQPTSVTLLQIHIADIETQNMVGTEVFVS